MKQEILSKLIQLDTELDTLIKRLDTLPEVRLQKKPSADAWSVVQVMYHLMNAEQLSQLYLDKKMKGYPNIKKAGIGSSLRSLGLKLVLKSPFKFKAPKNVDVALPDDLKFSKLAEQWKTQRASLNKKLADIPEDAFGLEAFKHPLGGKMEIGHMLDFFDSHFKRHQKQIDRILA